MDVNALPTKRNLLQARHNLSLARKGYHLMDMRHKALLHELNEIKNTTRMLRNELRDNIITAYQLLAIAQMEIGKENLDNVWIIAFSNKHYNLSETSVSVDEAFEAWRKIVKIKQKLIESEAIINRLNELLQRIRKRAAALRNITIPKYEARIKYISEQLEERERDELVRIKTAKKNREQSPTQPHFS
ncbi:MAG: hypothetical protein FWE05_03625 [Defluviitaleaceae bacterium]|nr:hypothetical protein [Defluviitaleaceae bacterium]